jgi:toxin-antitoxin system PIN domain toxin
VILPDVNVLIHAFRRDASDHEKYKHWLESELAGGTVVGVSDMVLSSVVRIVTHPRVFITPSPSEEVFRFTDYLRSRANVINVAPGKSHWSIFRHLCSAVQARGNLIADAYLAALAIESGAEWITTDRDYARFPGLRWRCPL